MRVHDNSIYKPTLAILLTYNAANWLGVSLDALIKCKKFVDIAVVDNCSTDNTNEIIRTQYLSDIDYYYPLDSNLGFGRAHNVVFRDKYIDHYDYTLLINQDASIDQENLNRLTERLKEYTEYGILSPLQLYTQEKLDYKFAKFLFRKNEPTEEELVPTKEDKIVEVPFVNAAIWLVRKEALQRVGGFNPVFRHYGEDNDFCRRVYKVGYKVGVYCNTLGFHLRQQVVTIEDGASISFDRLYSRWLSILLDRERRVADAIRIIIRNFVYNVRESLLGMDHQRFGKYIRAFFILLINSRLILKDRSNLSAYR